MASKESLRHYRNLHPKSTETTRPPRLSVISFNNCLTKFMDDIFDSKRFDHGNFSPQTLKVAVFFQFHSCLSFSYISYDTNIVHVHAPTFSIRKLTGLWVNWVWFYKSITYRELAIDKPRTTSMYRLIKRIHCGQK